MSKHLRKDGAGSQSTDPVCGMTVEDGAQNRYTYQDTEYLFCSGHCLTKFKADPAQYTG
ncbi:MAG TPA: YHS domain-containing protein, partial [Acidiferrobacteraceae bacterium]|nr:YHS domain-containing protein [Acidiferrobacteraceae bacterium]HEX19641.1 YHS domain-containing protein [Acidiferrobacteraceae bacterium]